MAVGDHHDESSPSPVTLTLLEPSAPTLSQAEPPRAKGAHPDGASRPLSKEPLARRFVAAGSALARHTRRRGMQRTTQATRNFIHVTPV
jgi:hypothetical protein